MDRDRPVLLMINAFSLSCWALHAGHPPPPFSPPDAHIRFALPCWSPAHPHEGMLCYRADALGMRQVQRMTLSLKIVGLHRGP